MQRSLAGGDGSDRGGLEVEKAKGMDYFEFEVFFYPFI